MSLRGFAINITAMSSVGVVRLLAQFFAIPILSRLLSPADYGVLGLAMPFIIFALTLADPGVSMSLVRTPATDRKAWSTCFWLSLLLGLALGGLMAGFAPVAAMILGEPRLGPIIMALALIIVAQALVAIPGASLQQSQQFKVIAGTELAPTVAGIATAVAIAFRGGGVWALVGQQLVFYAVRLILVLTFSSFRPRLVFDWTSAREHVLFGGNVLGTNLLGLFLRSTDNLIIGKVAGITPVGLYAMGLQFARLPMMMVTGPMQYVLYAQLAKIKDDKVAIRRAFIFLTRSLALVIFPIVGMVAVAHQQVFDLILSAKWSESGELFMIIAPVCALQAVTSLGGTVLMVTGRADIQLRNTVEFGIIWIVALLSSVWFGIWWVAVAYNIAVLAYLPRSLHMVLPHIECPARVYLGAFITPMLSTLLGIGVFFGMKHLLEPGEWPQLGFGGVIALVGIGASALLQRRAFKREFMEVRTSASL